MKISACIIAKNEEENLPILLESIKGKFDEIVLIDTGSTDRTVDIAKEYGCKVFYREWNGFADARNYAVEKATGDWIWFFDADMELEEKEYERFKKIIHLIDKNENINAIRVIYRNINKYGKILSLSTTIHIHKKAPGLKWIGKIHERLINEKGNIITPNFAVYVNHYGYADLEIMKEKIKRNLNLLEEELKLIDKDKEPEEYLIKLFYLAQTYAASSNIMGENVDKAIYFCEEFLNFKKSKDALSDNNLFSKHIYVYLLNSYIIKNMLDKAKESLNEAFNIDRNYPDFHYINAFLKEKEGKKEESVNSFLEFVKLVDKIYISKDEINYVSDYSQNIKYIVEEKLPNMIKDYKKISQIWKKEKGIYLGLLLSKLYLKEENLKDATKVLNKLYRIYDDPMVANKLSDLYKQIDQKKSEKILKDTIKKHPTYSETYFNLAKLYEEKGLYKEALNLIIRYTRKTRDVRGIHLLHKLLKINGFNKEAKTLEEKLQIH